MHINYLAVVVAAVAGFLLGWGWYSVFGKVWMAGLGKSKEDCDKPMPVVPLVVAAVACLVMAYMLAGLMGPSRQCHDHRRGDQLVLRLDRLRAATVATNHAFRA
jgi:hypothetical protein